MEVVDCDAEEDVPETAKAACSREPTVGTAASAFPPSSKESSLRKRPRSEHCPPTTTQMIDVDDDDDDTIVATGTAQLPQIIGKDKWVATAPPAPPQVPAVSVSPAPSAANELVVFTPVRQASVFTIGPSPAATARKERLAERGLVIYTLPRSLHIEDSGSRFSAFLVSKSGLTFADVKDVVAEIRSDLDVSRAEHSGIYACRLAPPPPTQEGSFTRALEYSDDDREDYSSSKVMGVLRQHRLMNIVVVIVRWFGGQLLGPRRFTHIVNATDRVLRLHKLTP